MSAICREGHISDEPDYCSVCGAPITATPGGPGPSAARSLTPSGTPIPIPRSAVVHSSAVCPSCGETREDPDGRFCEVCRFDFVENRPGPPPVARGVAVAAPPPNPRAAPGPTVVLPVAMGAPSTATPVAAPVAPTSVATLTPAPAAAALPASWELVITVDAALDTEPDADSPCPVDRAEIVLPVDRPDMLVGRHDETRAIHPEVSLHDPGASRRHAKFVLDPDGGISLQDLASTNGTQVNGQDVPPGTKRRLRQGDGVTLGRWTRITVRGRA